MRLKLPVIICTAVFAVPGHAQEGIYVGLGAGSFDYDEPFNPGARGTVADTLDIYKLFGGFEVNQHLLIEVGYGKTSDLEYATSFTVDPFGEIDYQYIADFTMTTARAVGQLPLDWGILLAGLGFYSSENDFLEIADADCCGRATNGGTLSDSGATAMLGIEWRFGRLDTQIGFRLEYEWWDIGVADTSAIGLALSYGF
ncbi:MAG: outer membrane beta-barrel protein [Gammaproteobacteria bacterium]|nr:outer membrane beta-barrel protein [Gammaproteobacteria bacterium]